MDTEFPTRRSAKRSILMFPVHTAFLTGFFHLIYRAPIWKEILVVIILYIVVWTLLAAILHPTSRLRLRHMTASIWTSRKWPSLIEILATAVVTGAGFGFFLLGSWFLEGSFRSLANRPFVGFTLMWILLTGAYLAARRTTEARKRGGLFLFPYGNPADGSAGVTNGVEQPLPIDPLD